MSLLPTPCHCPDNPNRAKADQSTDSSNSERKNSEQSEQEEVQGIEQYSEQIEKQDIEQYSEQTEEQEEEQEDESEIESALQPESEQDIEQESKQNEEQEENQEEEEEEEQEEEPKIEPEIEPEIKQEPIQEPELQQPEKLSEKPPNVPVFDQTTKPCSKLVWILGGPGISISSFASKLSQELSLIYLHIDHLVANAINTETPEGKEILETIKAGNTIPSSLLIPVIQSAIDANRNVATILIDGFPRSLSEANEFEQKIYPFSLILIYKCSELEQIVRVSQRSKDNLIPINYELNLAMQITNIKAIRKCITEIIVHYPEIKFEIEDEAIKESTFYKTKCIITYRIPECVAQSKV